MSVQISHFNRFTDTIQILRDAVSSSQHETQTTKKRVESLCLDWSPHFHCATSLPYQAAVSFVDLSSTFRHWQRLLPLSRVPLSVTCPLLPVNPTTYQGTLDRKRGALLKTGLMFVLTPCALCPNTTSTLPPSLVKHRCLIKKCSPGTEVLTQCMSVLDYRI